MQLKTGLILIFIDKSPNFFFSNVKKGYMHTPTERIVHFFKNTPTPQNSSIHVWNMGLVLSIPE